MMDCLTLDSESVVFQSRYHRIKREEYENGLIKWAVQEKFIGPFYRLVSVWESLELARRDLDSMEGKNDG